MVRFKMVGRDVDAIPTQYRTWVVEDEPDFTGQFYTGLKSGTNPFIDVAAYVLYDDSTVADFNLPTGTDWTTVKKTLPRSIADSQLAIIDGYVYLFGGKLFSNIYRTPTDRPIEWVDTGATLPDPLFGSQLAIVGDYIYLFGGNNGLATDHIYSAPIDDPLTWTDNGALLPSAIYDAQVVIVGGSLFLLGGRGVSSVTTTVYAASNADPLTWFDTGETLTEPLYGSQVAIVDTGIYLFGGWNAPNTPTKNIYYAPITDPTDWNIINYLPYPIAGGQFFEVGDKGYLITPGSVSTTPKSKGTRILRCNLSSPTQWVDTLKYVPGEVSESQVAIINDRIFLFGGNASSVIFVNAPEMKFSFTEDTPVAYGSVTRTQYNATPIKTDLFAVLGFPYWKTDYGS